MTKRQVLLILAVSCSFVAGCSSSPTTAPKGGTGGAAPQTKGDEIALSAAQQVEGGIETQAVTLSDKPQTLRVAGRIALADDRIARVGVRTVGLVMEVYAGLGDYVKKDQVLARYH